MIGTATTVSLALEVEDSNRDIYRLVQLKVRKLGRAYKSWWTSKVLGRQIEAAALRGVVALLPNTG